MAIKQSIMVVDDDQNIAQLIRLYLEKEGYEVSTYGRGDDALAALRLNPPSLMLLDIMLPGMDGWQVCRAVRQISSLPIIMLSAKDETFDKVLGLELGADDYITKPFDPKEMIARVKAVLRRGSAGDQAEAEALSFPGLIISLNRYEVLLQGNPVEMPPKELELLHFLASHPNQVFTREQLLEKVWGFDYFGDSRTVDVHVKRLRENWASRIWLSIRTVWSVGYNLRSDDALQRVCEADAGLRSGAAGSVLLFTGIFYFTLRSVQTENRMNALKAQAYDIAYLAGTMQSTAFESAFGLSSGHSREMMLQKLRRVYEEYSAYCMVVDRSGSITAYFLSLLEEHSDLRAGYDPSSIIGSLKKVLMGQEVIEQTIAAAAPCSP